MNLYNHFFRIRAKFLPQKIKDFIRNQFYYFGIFPKYGDSLINKGKLEFMLFLIEKCIYENLEGDIIECGVFRGGSALQIGKKLKKLKSNKKLFALDTFEGHPFHTKEDYMPDGKLYMCKSCFSNTSHDKVKEIVKKNKLNNVILLKGRFDQIFPSLKDRKFCFAHIDADLYVSIKQCIEFLKDRMVKSGIILFDDYNSPVCGEANKAIEEMLGKSFIVVLPEKGCYWIKK